MGQAAYLFWPMAEPCMVRPLRSLAFVRVVQAVEPVPDAGTVLVRDAGRSRSLNSV